jgi:hypothetical protein
MARWQLQERRRPAPDSRKNQNLTVAPLTAPKKRFSRYTRTKGPKKLCRWPVKSRSTAAFNALVVKTAGGENEVSEVPYSLGTNGCMSRSKAKAY